MRRQEWRVLLAAVLVLVLWSVVEPGCVAVGADEKRPPNVVLFLVDDLGWTDLGLPRE